MKDANRFDIFISYSSTDRQTVEFIADGFERQNWRVWWDRRIAAGEYFDEEIEQALDASAVVILLWSKTAADSPWVRAEAEEAASRSILIPARLDRTKLPLRMRRIQAVDLIDWHATERHEGFEALLKATAKMLGKPVLQSGPLPTAAAYVEEGDSHKATGQMKQAAEAYIRALKIDSEYTAAADRLTDMFDSGSMSPPSIRDMKLEIELGVVTWFNSAKGFGFVAAESSSLPLFVHIGAVEGSGYSVLTAGQRIAFLRVTDRGKSGVLTLKVI